MNERYLYIFLSAILKNGDIASLLNQGLSYREIAELTDFALKEEYIIHEEKSVFLSEKGDSVLANLREKLKKTDKDKWISKETKSIIPKIEKDFIYLPDQNELFF